MKTLKKSKKATKDSGCVFVTQTCIEIIFESNEQLFFYNTQQDHHVPLHF